MIALVQRVLSASVSSNDSVLASINKGLVVLIGISSADSEDDIHYIVDKVSNLRIFSNENGHFDESIINVSGSVLLVSQFTLMASTKKGRRPSFQDAMNPVEARGLYCKLVDEFHSTGLDIKTGQFQTNMKVSLVNDGPVTVIVDSKK
ncbi:MAG: D-tyrosyl-tRNA(Tyr) deacylase [Chloroflexi bacterium]|nr:D-tyrosyl-tRNA(Tyr) deacylase [Chloroflexota bacterium]